MSSHMFSAVSLFSGAGGMDTGFEAAGIEIAFANEINQDAAETYRANHPSGNMITGDIREAVSVLGQYQGVDLVFGGPPCQGFSVAGKMNPHDDRSGLIFTFLEAVERIKPRAFIMENVKALGTLKRWEPVRRSYLERAVSAGYRCAPFLLNATEYGVSQKRERVFFVGVRTPCDADFEKRVRRLLELRKRKAPVIRALLYSLGKAGSARNPNTCAAKITFAVHPIMRKSPYAGMYFNGQGRPIDVDGYANTLPASMGGNKTPFLDEEYLYGNAPRDWVAEYHQQLVSGGALPTFREIPERLRRITIREAARIQTFPENYVFHGSQSAIYAQIGNAVPCKMAEAVAGALVAYLNPSCCAESEHLLR